jgi:hypothetical protein
MNRPQAAWEIYRLAAYKTLEPLAQTQERECSMAFYAGMMEAFSMVAAIADVAADEESGSDQLEGFRQEIGAAAARANLNRNDGRS